MTWTRLAIAGTVAAIAATVLLFGGIFREGGAAQSTPVAAAQLPGDFASGDTQSLVLSLEQEVHARPADAQALTSLGLAYQQRARETADATFLSRSAKALRRAVALAPRDSIATGGLASLALSRHEFRQALVLARRARALAPSSARPFALIGDALIELGRYDEAFAAYDALASSKPGLAAYARVAYGRELLGRRSGAVEAMTLAVDAAGARAEPAAWARVELAKLHFGQGNVDAAAREYRAALAVFPGYVFALEGLAHAEAARGDREHAIKLARRAAETVPLPQLVTTLGDLYRTSSRERLAGEQYRLIGAIERLLRANGVRTDLELALFNVDHGIRLQDALALARASHAERPSIDGDDVLAWALLRNGRCGEALHYSKRALRLGTLDAAKFFHRGMIERCLGRQAEARSWFRRALALNPHFSLLWAPVARRYAA